MATEKKTSSTRTKAVEKDATALEKELLLTEDEYSKKVRQRNKEAMNRVLRVVGLIASFILIYAGLFDPLFEMSFFGWMADGISKPAEGTLGSHEAIWQAVKQFGVFDDPMQFGLWLPKLGITMVVILAVIGTIYLLVYNIVDIIALIKNLYTSTTALTQDFTGTVKDTVDNEKELNGLRRPKKKDLFKEVNDEFKLTEEKTEKIKKPLFPRRSEKVVDTSETGGLTEAQLDALLSGESLDVISPKKEATDEKDLFTE